MLPACQPAAPLHSNSEHINNTTVQHQDPVRVVERATVGFSVEPGVFETLLLPLQDVSRQSKFLILF